MTFIKVKPGESIFSESGVHEIKVTRVLDDGTLVVGLGSRKPGIVEDSAKVKNKETHMVKIIKK